MASLKEIKSRIQSVKSTQKITSAMKMISSSKLRKAQKTIENFYPYDEAMTDLLNNFLSAETDFSSPFANVKEIKRVAIVSFASNSSLCGGYNASVFKQVEALIQTYDYLGKENILLYPIGKNVGKRLSKLGYTLQGNFEEMAEAPTFVAAKKMADNLMELFLNDEIDKVILVFHHFKNKSVQTLMEEALLPLSLSVNTENKTEQNYIVEPSKIELINDLLPRVIRLRLFTALLDANASEHAARTMAMQIATDNADDLLDELSLIYNKTRQQAITNELLDIMGGVAN